MYVRRITIVTPITCMASFGKVRESSIKKNIEYWIVWIPYDLISTVDTYIEHMWRPRSNGESYACWWCLLIFFIMFSFSFSRLPRFFLFFFHKFITTVRKLNRDLILFYCVLCSLFYHFFYQFSQYISIFWQF